MVYAKESRAQRIRASLDHPIIDADGHTLEVTPVLLDFVAQVGGTKMRAIYEQALAEAMNLRWYNMSMEERRDEFATAPAWWFQPTKNSLDRATASLPRLLHQRMDELGLDFAILYPTLGLFFDRIPDPEARQVGCRAVNTYHAELYGPYSDRMTPAAAIPMHTPQAAIEELAYAVDTLGLKVAMIEGRTIRPLPKIEKYYPKLSNVGRRMDLLAMDSDYDYDPFWSKCLELKVAPASHAANLGWTTRSISNYMFNHLGTFSMAHEPLAKALFMGGVTKRFPDLNFAFLEGGVGWACRLYSDMVGHWEKRNGRDIHNLDPKNLDVEMVISLLNEYGEENMKSHAQEIRDMYLAGEPSPDEVDDWSMVPMEKAEQIKDLFVQPFYFGCEADDPINAWAFNTKVNPFGAKLKAIFSSDIGHWDVPDMRGVVEEAYELVEKDLVVKDDFRDFTFTNSVHLYADSNPEFFKGTSVEEHADKVINAI